VALAPKLTPTTTGISAAVSVLGRKAMSQGLIELMGFGAVEFTRNLLSLA